MDESLNLSQGQWAKLALLLESHSKPKLTELHAAGLWPKKIEQLRIMALESPLRGFELPNGNTVEISKIVGLGIDGYVYTVSPRPRVTPFPPPSPKTVVIG